ncbi:amino acid transporter [Demequina activiva]|uniref:Amino acid transporter n=1 Tax=Demequina activiva TaxID=1582364 RepID=A0A919UM57_9MICO|nr:amino acid transporter [Demequina activiva]
MGLLGAIGIGVGAMLGAGVFSDMWGDVLAAGRWYLLAVVLAGAVALANALSTAQLAARHPVAGGAYAYGRAELNPLAGHVAGAAFVVGKTVSVAVGALVLGAYVLPGQAHVTATAAIVLCWALNARGITKTAAGATVIAIVVVTVLAAVVTLSVLRDVDVVGAPLATDQDALVTLPPLLVGAAAAFFAFAGYARIATLGEEVRDPGRTIPRAILIALGLVFVLYAAVAWALDRLGTDLIVPATPTGGGTVETTGVAAPIEQLARAAGLPVWAVTATAALSIGGAMLAVMAGAGRTAMAMAREGDLPRALAHQGASGAPWRAEGVIALVAVVLVWSQGVSLILVSVACILLYYAVANLAAIRQRRARRTATLRVPVWVCAAGLAGCTALGAVALVSASGALAPAAVVLTVVVGWPLVAAALRRSRARA